VLDQSQVIEGFLSKLVSSKRFFGQCLSGHIFGDNQQNGPKMVWFSFSIDPLCVPNYMVMSISCWFGTEWPTWCVSCPVLLPAIRSYINIGCPLGTCWICSKFYLLHFCPLCFNWCSIFIYYAQIMLNPQLPSFAQICTPWVNSSYCEVGLLSACAYIFWRKLL